MSITKVERRNRKGESYSVYQARYRDTAGRLHQQTFRTKAEARAFEQAAATDVRRGAWTDPQLGRVRFRTFAEEWLRTTVDLRPTTRSRNQGILAVHLLPRFGDRRICEIVAVDVRAFLAEQVASGLAPATVSKHLRLFSQIMAEAVRSRFVGVNPCSGVKPPALGQDEMLFLEPVELNDLADAMDPRFRAMVLLAGYRGLRWGEITGLRPERVNLMRNRVEISEILVEVAGKFSFGPPKTSQGRRTVPLPDFLTETLSEHMGKFGTEEFVFTGARGNLLHRSNFARSYWSPAVAQAGVHPDLTFHGLRHTAVSILAAEGAQLNELASIMGWSRSTAASMAVRYAHLFPSRQEHLTGRLDAVFRAAERERSSRPDDILMTLRARESGS
ncbi:MAG: tyrosine-type recombinase/integrase [Actinomycetota bacterium]